MPGGVCAVLDYEVDHMAEYVSEMAVRLVTPELPVTERFRKFVTQILTSTRLPSSTVLLGMNYLAKRMNRFKSAGAFNASEGQVWRLLTVGLLLGSKFLDDNTFQNRSWSEVSGIAVAELNTLEFEWLDACQWQLHINLNTSKDYMAWIDSWNEWHASKKRQEAEQARAAEAARARKLSSLPLLQTGYSRQQTVNTPCSTYLPTRPALVASFDLHNRFSAKKNEMVSNQNYRPHEGPWGQSQYRPTQAPITPPDSGYSTPEYIMSAASANARYNDWFAQAIQYSNGYQHSQAQVYYSRQANYPSHYPYSPWEQFAECTCPSCHGCAAKQPYVMTPGFGQPVAG